MKICILTHPLHTNYGGLLQAYALQTVLKRMGHEVVTDRYGAWKYSSSFGKLMRFIYHSIRRYIFRDRRYNPFNYFFTSLANRQNDAKQRIAEHTERFIDDHIATIDFFKGKSTPSDGMLACFDALVVGSDQVWRRAYSHVISYFLHFLNETEKCCVAYAASFGLDHISEYSSREIQQCSASAKSKFKAISVREDSGVTICNKQFGVEAMHVLDPTLLLEKEDYLPLIEEEDLPKQNSILMCYVLDKSPEKRAIIDSINEKLSLTPLEVMPKEQLNAKHTNIEAATYPSVSKWIAGFRDAEFVVTDSFHGTVFSIIFNKPFVAISNAQRGASRFTSLLRIFGLEHRLIHSKEELTEQHLLPMDFTAVNQTKRAWQEKSFDFLKRNLQ